jgi:hypothetical protein
MFRDMFETGSGLAAQQPDIMGAAMDGIGSKISGALFGVAAVFLVLIGYFFITWERRRADSPMKDDEHAHLKLTLYALMIIALGIAAGGLVEILGYLLSGAKGGSIRIKGGISHLVSGGAGLVALFFLFLPRTNAKDYPKAEQYASGVLALFAGMMALNSFDDLLSGLFAGGPWLINSAHLSSLLVMGAITAIALFRFGALSGWTVPVRTMPMPQQGYPQQGFPQQQQQQQQQVPQQGYPPQGGGYPPQGGGVPPQGGGQPPGGGYNPQGGGGLPPPSGGGYPPPGGGGYPGA